ncbi:PIN domain-containing protein [Micromonospora chersina]|uniref:PIN domain-containing protein n=1 Tax=Micromonospora chersina TaxID=47854 RepID=UPI0037147CB1
MTGLSDGFESFLVPSEDDIRRAITQGLVVLDTNVLLEAYRFAPTARGQLFTVLRSLGDRLWIPHQVALEFHKNRLSVIASFDDSYNQALKAVDEFRATVEEVLGQKAAELANRVSLSERERRSLLTPITHGLNLTQERLSRMRKRHGLEPESLVDDPILQTLRAVFDGKVGPEMPADQRLQAIKEASRRAADKVPPGYKDFATKSDGSGDYLVWAQTLEEAARRKNPLLFVTRDAKEDWFLRLRGKTVCGRPELVAEARRVAGVQAIIMQTHTLLFHARSFLRPEISDETIRQAANAAGQNGPQNLHTLEVPADTLHQMIEQAQEDVVDAVTDLRHAMAKREEIEKRYQESSGDLSTEELTRRVQLSETRFVQAEERLHRAHRNLSLLRGAEKTPHNTAVISWTGLPQAWFFRAMAEKATRSKS